MRESKRKYRVVQDRNPQFQPCYVLKIPRNLHVWISFVQLSNLMSECPLSNVRKQLYLIYLTGFTKKLPLDTVKRACVGLEIETF